MTTGATSGPSRGCGEGAMPQRKPRTIWLTSDETRTALADIGKERERQHHPDKGGDPARWHAIQGAYEQALQGGRG